MSTERMATHLEDLPDLSCPAIKYNISFQEHPQHWDCYGIPTRLSAGSRSQQFPWVNLPHFFAHNASGVVFKRETLQNHEYPIFLGDQNAPRNVQALNFLGERMSSEQFRVHLIRHEVGHAAFNRDMGLVLQRAIPNQELRYLESMSQQAALSRQPGRFPLSKLYELGCYPTDEAKFLEDLAEMYAIYGRSVAEKDPGIWEIYKKLVCSKNPELDSLFGVIQALYEESQNPKH